LKFVKTHYILIYFFLIIYIKLFLVKKIIKRGHLIKLPIELKKIVLSSNM